MANAFDRFLNWVADRFGADEAPEREPALCDVIACPVSVRCDDLGAAIVDYEGAVAFHIAGDNDRPTKDAQAAAEALAKLINLEWQGKMAAHLAAIGGPHY